MSFAGRAELKTVGPIGPRVRGTGLRGYAARTQCSSAHWLCMETTEHGSQCNSKKSASEKKQRRYPFCLLNRH